MKEILEQYKNLKEMTDELLEYLYVTGQLEESEQELLLTSDDYE